MEYTNFEVDKMLREMTILIDTREQDNAALHKRIQAMGCSVERRKLDYGDYSCKCVLPDGREYSLQNKVVVERKMGADEICGNFTRGRARFSREFERAKKDGARVFVLIEGESWEKLLAGDYRSKLSPDALKASMHAWTARYDLRFYFCQRQTTGLLIRDILHYELKEVLESR